MRAKIRKGKKDDQKNAEAVFKLLNKLIDDNPGIEPNIWAAACQSLIVDSYVSSGLTYNQFCQSTDEMKLFYKSWWE